MIVTFTANPSIDRTIGLADALERGQVQRASSAVVQAAGKGVNVSAVLCGAGVPTRTVLAFRDPSYLDLLAEQKPQLDVVATSVDGPYRARVNTAITEPDGTTTKVNEAGPLLSAAQIAEATGQIIRATRDSGATWVVLSGSLPFGAPDDWYAQIIAELAGGGCRIAVDTSGQALSAVMAVLDRTGIDLLKPNSDELAELTGGDATIFEQAAGHGEWGEIVAAARRLHRRGIANVLTTLGGAGAVLVNDQGAWRATAPKVEVLSTVGAGDSSVAGFIAAQVAGRDGAGCLATAVAYGSAAASLPGTTLPTPADLRLDEVQVTRTD